MSSFAEVRFENGNIIYGTSGGAQFNTDVIELNSGGEARNQNWQYAKGKWDFGDRKMSEAELHAIRDFFRARKGKAQGFRFKDWGDYKDDGAGVLGLSGIGDGSTRVFQLVKNYTSGSDVDQRLIRKPVSGTIHVYDNGSPVSPTIDYTTGLVTFGTAPTTAHVLSWTGEFDCPVRFNVDEIQYRFESAIMASPGVVQTPYFYVASLPLVEVRV